MSWIHPNLHTLTCRQHMLQETQDSNTKLNFFFKMTGYVPETGFTLSRPWKVEGNQGNKKKEKKKKKTQ